MKNTSVLIYFSVLLFCIFAKAQEVNQLKSELAENACTCINKIDRDYQEKSLMLKDVSSCIDKQVNAYQLGAQLMKINIDSIAKKTEKSKRTTFEVNLNENSESYKYYYYDLENYLFKNCKPLQIIVKSDNTKRQNSLSDHPEALDWYNKGLKASENQEFLKAINHYKKAVEIDKNFAFAWDNLGLIYRKIGEYNKAIKAYKTSLKIDPNGVVPLQNLAVAYSYKKKYKKAIKTFEKLAENDPSNPETYYGIGQIYFQYLENYEKSLDYMCKAYKIYVEQKSPYRSDAENIISLIYKEMKAKNNLDTFNATLDKHQIKFE